ncbi:MAG: nickel pincer cofactor biosynthesis protein LarC [Planctomycetota bacterium]
MKDERIEMKDFSHLSSLMAIAYFDCSSGVSGDMILSALIDAGLPFSKLKATLNKLTSSYKVSLTHHRVERCGLSGLKIDISGAEKHISFNEIYRIIKKSSLPNNIKATSLMILNRLADIESKVHHNRHSKNVRLHELGSIDTLIDIVGSVLGIHHLGIKSIYISPLPLTEGTVKTHHGLYPLPAPATMEMLKGFELFKSNIKAELVTPTGAAILTTLGKPSQQIPQFTISHIGYGAGSLDIPTQPNILRVIIGKTADIPDNIETDNICVLETNIDNISAEIIGYVTGKLFKAGALDVFTIPIRMKKSRPGLLLKVLSSIDMITKMEGIIFNEIPTLGIRKYFTSRIKLKRTTLTVRTKYGPIRIKESRYGDTTNRTPEYDDCRKAAEKYNVPIRQVISEAVAKH